jgi:hypothetical protein
LSHSTIIHHPRASIIYLRAIVIFTVCMSSRLLLPLLLSLLACSHGVVMADLVVNIYSDSQCTTPSPLVPSISVPGLQLVYDEWQCISAASSQLSSALLPSPAPVSWFGVYCLPTTNSSFSQSSPGLALTTYDYSTPDGQCPVNVTGDFNIPTSNSSLDVLAPARYTPPTCSIMTFAYYNQSTGRQQTTTVYGFANCTNSNQPSNSATTAWASLSGGVIIVWLHTLLLALLFS